MEIQDVKAFVWTWVLPMICLYGLCMNFINILVFSAKRSNNSKNRLHTYLFIDSTVEFVYLFIGLAHFMLRHSSYKESYYVVTYEKLFYNYLASSLAFFMLFTKLFISLKRIIIVCNRKIRYLRMVKLKNILCLFFLLSFLFDVTFLVGVSITEKKAEHINQSRRFYLSYHKSESSLTIRMFYYISSSFRGLLAPALLLCVNLIFLRKLAQRLNTIYEIFKDTNQ